MEYERPTFNDSILTAKVKLFRHVGHSNVKRSELLIITKISYTKECTCKICKPYL